MAAELLQNTSQALEFIVGLALLAAVWRFRRAPANSRDFLLAFVVFLAGSLLREIVVRYGGASAWQDAHVMWSAAARGVQIAGAMLYVRATFHDRCGEWSWIAALAGTIVYAALT